MEARHRFGGGALAPGTVSPVLAQLIARLSGAAERAGRDGRLVVADTAAGPGDLLAAVAGLTYRKACQSSAPPSATRDSPG